MNYKHKILIAVAALSLLSSCDFSGEKKSVDTKIDVNSVEYVFQKGDCDTEPCIDIRLNYPKFSCAELSASGESVEGEDIKFNAMNSEVEAVVFSKMNISSDLTILNREELVSKLIFELKEFRRKYPSSSTGGYLQETDYKISYSNSKYLCVTLDSYVYTGGAHGIDVKEYLNLDVKTGKRIDLNSLITDKAKFVQLAEQKVKDELGMGNKDNWEDYSLRNSFVLPKNIGLYCDGFLLTYNPYELRSFSEGKTEVRIRFDELGIKI